jgi:hypothetical protein
LIVSRPVQQELDRLKKDARGRAFKKALSAGTLLRSLVIGQDDVHVVSEVGPRVTLGLMAATRLRPDLNPELDPQLNDDAILLRLLEFQHSHSERDVRLLTHDSGPMATAKGFSIPFLAIPDHWLAPMQDDIAAKATRELQAEIALLRSQEPVITIGALNADNTPIACIDASVDSYCALTAAEIERLHQDLRARCPAATDFGSAETIARPCLHSAIQRITVSEFKAADPKTVEAYRSKHAEWLVQCRKFLENLHHRLNARESLPSVFFEAKNTGTRPASKCLFRFVAKGDLDLDVPPKTEEGDPPPERLIAFSSPPSPPRGEWISMPTGVSRGLAAIMAQQRAFDPFAANARPISDRSLMAHHLQPKPRDSDRFYWKGGRSTTARDEIELTCENWRHGVEPEVFEFRIVPKTRDKIAGAVACEIHAENLTEPVVMTLPVRIEHVERSTLDVAKSIINQL